MPWTQVGRQIDAAKPCAAVALVCEYRSAA